MDLNIFLKALLVGFCFSCFCLALLKDVFLISPKSQVCFDRLQEFGVGAEEEEKTSFGPPSFTEATRLICCGLRKDGG